jgi:uncharacterized protein with gpF-like domain
MNNAISKVAKQARKARDSYDAAMINAINAAEYEEGRQAAALYMVDHLISHMSEHGDNSILIEALKGLVSVELAFNDDNQSAKITAQTDIRMNIDRDLDELKEWIADKKSELE